MKDLIEIAGLGELLDDAGLEDPFDDFESIYSGIVESKDHEGLARDIQEVVFEYFAGLQLPDEPTLYDHLVRALRAKDVVATFNWDPFLVQALDRHGEPDAWPNVMFLHGNTGIGYCAEHGNEIVIGPRDGICQVCGELLHDNQLLYPIETKNYNQDPVIANHWRGIQSAMRDAYIVTVFGYSAPDMDVEAIRLLREGWGELGDRQLEEVEIIDIEDSEALVDRWGPFIVEHHYQVVRDFYDSLIGQHPRRSCEAFWDATMEISPRTPTPVPRDSGWEELDAWYQGLREVEERWNGV